MIEVQTSRWEYNGDGLSTVFPYDTTIFAAENLAVYVDGAGPLLLGTDYVVSGAPDYLSGNVSFVTPPTAGTKNVILQRTVPALQRTAFPVGNSFPSQAVERAFDRQTVVSQQLEERVDRTLQVAPTVTADGPFELATLEAGQYLRVNATADGFETSALAAGAVVTASTIAQGIVELATQPEVDAGLDAARVITCETLAGSALAADVAQAMIDIDTLATVSAITPVNINSDGWIDVLNAAHAGVGDDTYCADGWVLLTSGGTVDVVAVEPAAGGPNGLALQATGAQRIGVAQIIEHREISVLVSQAATLAARLSLSTAGGKIIRYAILGWNGTPNVVPSDPVNNWASPVFTAGNFFKNTLGLSVLAVGSHVIGVGGGALSDLPGLSVNLPDDTYNNLIIMLWRDDAFAAGEIMTFRKIALVPGTKAGLYANEPYATALRRCQRFAWKSFITATAPAQNAGIGIGEQAWPQVVAASTAKKGDQVRFPIEMFGTPTVTLYNPQAANAQARNVTQAADCTVTTATNISAKGCDVEYSSPAGSSAGQRVAVHVKAEIRL